MKERTMGWKGFLARVLVLCLALGVTMRVALARDGEPGGRARSFVTIAGTVTGVAAGEPMMRFTFRRTVSEDGGTREQRCERDVRVPVAATGEFAAEVPLEPVTTECPESFFDGRDVRVDVSIGGTLVVDGGMVNPVPYAIHADTAAVASQYGTPDCPVGYTRATDPTFTGEMRLCQRRRADGSVFDEVVRVGAGSTAFWIDRYEASVWANADGSGSRYGVTAADYPGSFPRNGQWTAPVYSVSRAGVVPSAYLTWFQANEACRIGGGRLPTGSEWLTAARGTPDPGASPGTGGACATTAGGPRSTGGGTLCRSAWGAQDMIGNEDEWTDEWFAAGAGTTASATPWPGDFNGDGTENVGFGAIPFVSPPTVPGIPAATYRGGHYGDGARAGIYNMSLNGAPSSSFFAGGFRCVRTR